MKKKLKILFIEDSEDDALLISRNISQDGFDPVYERVYTPGAVEAALENKDWDIVLSDYNMPNFSGLDALKIFKKKNLKIPFIIISGTIGENIAVETIKKGATDYLMKDNLTRLIPSIKRGLQEAKTKVERKNALEKLVRSEKRFKELAELSPAMIVETDLDGKIMFANHAVYEFTGYSIKDFHKGINVNQLVIPEDRDRVKYNIKNKGRDISEYTALRKDGKKYPIIVYRDYIYNDKKIRIGLRAVIVDIRELKKTEKSLVQSEERLKSFMNSATELFSIWDSKIDLLELNKAAIKMFSQGARKKDLLGKNISDLIPGVKKTGNYDKYLEVIRTGKPFYHEQITPPQFGSKHLSVKVFKVGTGLGMLTADITENKKTEKLLQESEHRYKRLSESAEEGIVYHSKGIVLDANKAASKMLGVKLSDLIGMNSLDLLTPDSKKIAEEKIKTENMDPYEIQFKNPNGKILDVEVIGKSTYLNNRKVRVTVIRDMTERKKSEEEINNLAKFPSENPSPVIRIDLEGRIIFANEICKKKLKDWKCRKGNFIPDPIYGLVKNKLKGKAQTIEIVSGKNIYEFFITPIKEEGYVNLYGRDITGRKLAEDKLNKSYAKLQKTLNSTINALASIVEIRDPYTAGHQKRVTFLAIAISEELGLDKVKIENIGTAALIHDIGKITVPASILSKPGEISDIEFELIKKHPTIGYDIIKNIEFPHSIEASVIQHHERLDGSGYPKGLKGKDIIQEAKILAVADVVEAMSSHRPYRPSLGIKRALEEIDKGRKKLYDPKVVDACIRIIAEKKFEF